MSAFGREEMSLPVFSSLNSPWILPWPLRPLITVEMRLVIAQQVGAVTRGVCQTILLGIPGNKGSRKPRIKYHFIGSRAMSEAPSPLRLIGTYTLIFTSNIRGNDRDYSFRYGCMQSNRSYREIYCIMRWSRNLTHLTSFTVREKASVKLLTDLESKNETPTQQWVGSGCHRAHTCIAIPGKSEVIVALMADKKTLYTLKEKNVRHVLFSPKDTYIVTWRSREKEDNQTGGNVGIFEAKTGKPVRRYSQKSVERWPTIQWTKDEKFLYLRSDGSAGLFLGNQSAAFV
eukprot:1318922-Amorphochlora_amoeboformis.AAC.1